MDDGWNGCAASCTGGEERAMKGTSGHTVTAGMGSPLVVSMVGSGTVPVRLSDGRGPIPTKPSVSKTGNEDSGIIPALLAAKSIALAKELVVGAVSPLGTMG